MDIEGNEISVIEASREFLCQGKDIRIACCTYHRCSDADTLSGIFKSLDYKIEFSDGYIVFVADKNLQPPFFRKGLIRARNI